MTTTATCASCGQRKELCESMRSNGIKQPRVCKDCLVRSLTDGENRIKDSYWVAQMIQLGDQESLDAIAKGTA